jgi:tetratricopeptide (TPR) repeat protein
VVKVFEVGAENQEAAVWKRLVRFATMSSLLILCIFDTAVVAQQAGTFDDLKTEAAKQSLASLRTEPDLYQFLSSIALESFKGGDHVRAAKLVTVIERFWDGSETTQEIRRNSPKTYRAIDHAMDVFIGAVVRPKTDGSAAANAEAAYADYIAALQLKPLSQVLSVTIRDKGIDAAIQEYGSLQKAGFPGVLATEMDTNDLGYALLSKGETATAIRVFQLNVELYPKSANVYDSLADAYQAAGDKDRAIANYKLALAIDPNFESLPKLNKLQSP